MTYTLNQLCKALNIPQGSASGLMKNGIIPPSSERGSGKGGRPAAYTEEDLTQTRERHAAHLVARGGSIKAPRQKQARVPVPAGPRTYSLTELCTALGATKGSARDLIEKGVIPPTAERGGGSPGRYPTYTAADLEEARRRYAEHSKNSRVQAARRSAVSRKRKPTPAPVLKAAPKKPVKEPLIPKDVDADVERLFHGQRSGAEAASDPTAGFLKWLGVGVTEGHITREHVSLFVNEVLRTP